MMMPPARLLAMPHIRSATSTGRAALLLNSTVAVSPPAISCRSYFRGVLKKAGLPEIRFHDLRHTAATLMLADGVPLVTVSKILGHSSPAITAAIYAHALDDQKASAIASLGQRLRRTKADP